VGRYEVKLTQGLAVSLQAQYSWTIPSGAWTHRRALFKGEPEELVRPSVPQRALTTGSTRIEGALLTEMDSLALLAAGLWS